MNMMKTIRLMVIFMLLLFPLHGAGHAMADQSDLFKTHIVSQNDATYFQHVTPVSTIHPLSSSEENLSLDMGRLHKYLAYGTIILAGIAATTGSDSATHHSTALGAATLGVMTMATGYYEYSDMFDLDEGLSKTNLHIVLGTLGAIGFAAEAIIASSDSSHGGLGIGSAAAMGAACILIIW
jgi:hypothetical protein